MYPQPPLAHDQHVCKNAQRFFLGAGLGLRAYEEFEVAEWQTRANQPTTTLTIVLQL